MKKNYLLKSVEEKMTSTGKPYVVFEFTTKTDKMEGKMWNATKSNFEVLVGSVVEVDFMENLYNNQITYIVKALREPECNCDIKDYIETVPVDTKYMYDYIHELASNLNNETLKKITLNILEENKKKLMYWSAAKGCHHNLYGGLLYHTYRMVLLAEKISEIYSNPVVNMVNKDLLISGTILHDIGKLTELDTNDTGEAVYTTEGKLLGHLFIGMREIEKAYDKTKCNDKDTLLQLEHLIASHHGDIGHGWGSIKSPLSLEANLLHQIDMIDSRVYMFEAEYQKTEPGEFGEKNFGLGFAPYKNK